MPHQKFLHDVCFKLLNMKPVCTLKPITFPAAYCVRTVNSYYGQLESEKGKCNISKWKIHMNLVHVVAQNNSNITL